MDRAIAGATYLIHVASPFYLDNETVEELTKPAVEGTLSALKAAKKHGVKRVVVTSSIAAIHTKLDPIPDPITEEHWSVVDKMTAVADGYPLSKTLAEKAAWDFKSSADFEMVMINPGFVVGPGLIGKGYTSGEVLDKFMHGRLGSEAGMIRSLVEVSAVA